MRHPRAPAAGHLETLHLDDPSTRGGNPTMSSTDQQADAPAPADADVPAEHEVPDELALAAEFDAATREQWRDLVVGVLRKAGRDELPDPVEDALSVRVATGVTVEPLYTAEDAGDLPTAVGVPGIAPFVRGSRAGGDPAAPGGWDIRQRHAHPVVATTKEAIAADLENGVTSLWLVLGEGAIGVDALGGVLSDVLLDLAPVTVDGGLPAAEAFLSLVEGRTDLAAGSSLGLDPLGRHAATGEQQDLSGLADGARRGRRRAPPAWATSRGGPPSTPVSGQWSSTPPCSPMPARRRWRSSAARS